jgi:hypothetical protein
MFRKTLAALLILLVAAPALAQTRARKSDFYFSPTFVNGQSHTFEGGATMQTDTGTGFGFGWHYNFDAHASLGAEFGWGYIDYRATVSPDRGNPSQAPVRVNGTMYSSNLKFVGTYNLASGPLTPFITGNFGWTYIDTGVPSGLPQNDCWYWYYYYYCGTYQPTHATTKFAYGAGLGIRADVGRTFTFRGLVSQQYVDYNQLSTTPWTVWRIDLGARF